MDSNSNSSDIIPKIEIDSDYEQYCVKLKQKIRWDSEDTMKLIQTLEKDCRELWDTKHPLNRDRNTRQTKLEYLADKLGTTSEEISRKIHNLRTQLNNEMRKIKKRRSSSRFESGVVWSGWEYFDALSFLRAPQEEPAEAMDAVEMKVTGFQANEEGLETTTSTLKSSVNNNNVPRCNGSELRAAASICRLNPNEDPLWPDDYVPEFKKNKEVDESQIFGDFVASELRSLCSNESRKKLKRLIQKAILQIGEEDDALMKE